MSPPDQVLLFLSAAGVVLMVAALINLRSLRQAERELEAQRASKVHPAQ